MYNNRSRNNKNTNRNSGKRRPPRVTAKIDRLYESDDSAVKAYASVNIAGMVAIHGLRVMDSDKGLFVAMPSRTYEDRNGETKYADIAHPISAEARTAINDSVLKAYENALAEEQTQSGEDELSDYDDIDEDDLPFEQSM